MEDSSEDAIPGEKSGVRVDPKAKFATVMLHNHLFHLCLTALQPTPRFSTHDTVHMSETIGGAKVKGTYQIYSSRYNRGGGFTEYQLMVPFNQALHNKGHWYREKELRMDKRS